MAQSAERRAQSTEHRARTITLSSEPIAINLGVFGKKVSPPFKGGVDGIADYGMFTILLSRPGWLNSLIKSELISQN